MRIEGGLFLIGTVFYGVIAAIYWFLSYDPIGTTVLTLTGVLGFIIAFYVLYTSKRVYPRPEDRLTAEIDEADPEYGFFSPHSWWPLVLGASTMLIVLGLVFANWLTAFGVFVLIIGLVGYFFEYYRRDFSH
jgi:Co/Zn/Cd efflux system component